MTETVTYSTLFLTLLMMVGLVFFIRASTKDRIETLVMRQPGTPQTWRQTLIAYFEGRAYTMQAPTPPSLEADQGSVELRGYVRPSVFLAIFLTILAGIGTLCFALVLTSLFPGSSRGFMALILLAPLAGGFYWRRAGREEQVTFQVGLEPTAPEQSQLTVTAHRDELLALKQTLSR
ncbi:MAG: cofactor assembly of complex C subunit B [Nodosilinea sp.]